MKENDIFKEITRKSKWYAGIRNDRGVFYNAQSANRIKHRFQNGTLSLRIKQRIFGHHGYVKKEIIWE